MIDFSRAQLTHLIMHQVGNKGLGHELRLSQHTYEFNDDFVKEQLLRYFLTPFKTDVYYRFKGKIDLSLNSVANTCEDIFMSRADFVEKTGVIANILWDQSIHPKIAGGPLYVCYFKDVVCDGELVNAIGIFKTEKQKTFLKLLDAADPDDIAIEAESGIDIKTLDKGCLVFDTDQKHGYKLSIIDNNNRVAECSLYWQEDFLNAALSQNSYYHTSNLIDIMRGFREEVLTEANNVPRLQGDQLLSEALAHVATKEKFHINDFEREVLQQPDIIEAFEDYRADYAKRLDVAVADEFDVSDTAVKKNQKYRRQVVKLDKNFHIYIHAKHDYVEQGFDEEKGLKYYKLYYVNEEH